MQYLSPKYYHFYGKDCQIFSESNVNSMVPGDGILLHQFYFSFSFLLHKYWQHQALPDPSNSLI